MTWVLRADYISVILNESCVRSLAEAGAFGASGFRKINFMGEIQMKIATWLFLVFGAIQVFCPATKAETLDFAIIADGGEWNSSARLTRDSVLRTPIRSLILPGDNLYNSNYANVWGNWSQNGFTFDVPAIGNHNDGYEAEMAFFRMPGEYFSKVYPGIARFIVLNSDNNSTGSTQASFLDSELTAATEPFVFLVYHHPTYTLSHFHGWKDKKKFQQAIRPVLWRRRLLF
jgi:hypothetical protein